LESLKKNPIQRLLDHFGLYTAPRLRRFEQNASGVDIPNGYNFPPPADGFHRERFAYLNDGDLQIWSFRASIVLDVHGGPHSMPAFRRLEHLPPSLGAK